MALLGTPSLPLQGERLGTYRKENIWAKDQVFFLEKQEFLLKKSWNDKKTGFKLEKQEFLLKKELIQKKNRFWIWKTGFILVEIIAKQDLS